MADDMSTPPALLGERWYKVSEIASALRVSVDTVYRAIRRGELGADQVGRSWRISESALRAYRDRIAQR